MARKDKSIFIADNVQGFLDVFAPNTGATETRIFPDPLITAFLKIPDELPARQWLAMIQDHYEKNNDNIYDHCLEPELFLAGQVSFENGKIADLSLSAVFHRKSIFALLLEENDADAYFRLDYQLDKIGEIFSHPIPHLHFVVHDAPRVFLGQFENGHTILSFIEFL